MSLSYRMSVVGWMNMLTLSHASAVQVGDTYSGVDLMNKVLAIHRADSRFEGDELRFAEYPMFYLPTIVPAVPPRANINTTSNTGTLEVGAIRVLGATASSLIRIGSCYGPHRAESRILDIRHFNAGTPADLGFQSQQQV